MLCAILACASDLIDLDIALDIKNVFSTKPAIFFLFHQEKVCGGNHWMCLIETLPMVTKINGPAHEIFVLSPCHSHSVGSKYSSEPAQLCSLA